MNWRLLVMLVCLIVITHDQGLGLHGKGRNYVESSVRNRVGGESQWLSWVMMRQNLQHREVDYGGFCDEKAVSLKHPKASGAGCLFPSKRSLTQKILLCVWIHYLASIGYSVTSLRWDLLLIILDDLHILPLTVPWTPPAVQWSTPSLSNTEATGRKWLLSTLNVAVVTKELTF